MTDITTMRTLIGWSAYTDDYDGADDAGPQLIGIGVTEYDAIRDLVNKLESANA